MNYLAHLFLAGGSPEAVAGHVLADFVKGKDLDALCPEMRRGVQLHRSVDAFTDSHPVVLHSRQRLSSRWPRVSGILTDIYYDHVLARDWKRYSPVELREFLDAAYCALRSCAPKIAPSPMREAAQRLVEHDLLMKYTRLEGIEWALQRMSRRLCHGRFQLEKALEDLVLHDSALARDFHEFFPKLQSHVRAIESQLDS